MKNERLEPGEWAIACDPSDPDNTKHLVFRTDREREANVILTACLNNTNWWLVIADLAFIKEAIQLVPGYENYTVRRATREEAISYL